MKLKKLLPAVLLTATLSPFTVGAEPFAQEEVKAKKVAAEVEIHVDKDGNAEVKNNTNRLEDAQPAVEGKKAVKPKRETDEGPQKPVQPMSKKVAFLGVSMTAVNPVLRDYLEIPEGQGVMIRLVAKDSPAAKAGVKAKDIVLSVEGEDVGNEHELRKLIQSLKPEQEVAIQVLRKGKTVDLKATLAEHTIRVQPNVKWFDRNNNQALKVIPGELNQGFQVIPIDPEHQKQLPDNVKEMLEKHFQNINPKNLEIDDLQLNLNDHFKQFDNEGMPEGIREQVRKMEQLQRELLKQLRENKFHNKLKLDFAPNGEVQSNVSQSISHSDGTHSLTLKIENNDRHLTVKDRDGKVLFDGPVNNDKQREAVPNEILPKLNKLEKMSRINFKMIPHAPEKDQKDSKKKRVTL